MPLVFVHGVATRMSEEGKARNDQRDKLFRKLVLPPGAQVFDPDWGSNAVQFTESLPWLPTPGGDETFTFGGKAIAAAGTELGMGSLARERPELAIDLAFEAALDAQAVASAKDATVATLSESDLRLFKAAVDYLENPDATVFDPKNNDEQFLSTLKAELVAADSALNAGPQAMGMVGDLASWLAKGLRTLVNPIANASSDAVLRLLRRPLSQQLALFLGDIFVYLRFRETQGAAGTENRIFRPIADALMQAAKVRTQSDPLIVVCHSLGGVILYDMLSDPNTVGRIEKELGPKLEIDVWLTVGSQPGLFADFGLYGPPPAQGKRPRPAGVKKWLNVYDYTDVLSFRCAPLFDDVEDFKFDNVTGLFLAHTSYFLRPSFYTRMRKRLT